MSSCIDVYISVVQIHCLSTFPLKLYWSFCAWWWYPGLPQVGGHPGVPVDGQSATWHAVSLGP